MHLYATGLQFLMLCVHLRTMADSEWKTVICLLLSCKRSPKPDLTESNLESTVMQVSQT